MYGNEAISSASPNITDFRLDSPVVAFKPVLA